MARLVIAGAGGLGREVLDWARSSPRWRAEHGVDDFGYLADAPPPRPVHAPLLSSIDEYRVRSGDRVVVAVGDPEGRRDVVARLSGLGAVFGSLVHDSVHAGADVTVPPGAILCPGVVVGSGAVLGEHVLINAHSYLGHDSTIGDYATISPGCAIGGSVAIGHGTLLGLGVTVGPHASIGSGSTVGAGSTVIRDIPSHVVAYGSPARVAQ